MKKPYAAEHDGNGSLDEETEVDTLFVCLSFLILDTGAPAPAKPPVCKCTYPQNTVMTQGSAVVPLAQPNK